jgi:Fur family ferric uptake transcriptional regulator
MSSSSADRLRACGLHVTAQRLAVLRAVEHLPHASADRIMQHVRGELGTVSTQAVYDALAALCEHGLVRRLQPAGFPALFDPRAGDGHHHAVCRQCGAIRDIDCGAQTAPCLMPPTDCGYRIEAAEIVYWGLCAHCQTPRAHPGDADQRAHGTQRNHAN